MRAISRLAVLLVLTLPITVVGLSPRPTLAEEMPDRIAKVVARVQPAVVKIVTTRPDRANSAPETPETTQAVSPESRTTAVGSGFIVDPAGFVATNKHVVEDAVSVFVLTAEGVRYKAKIVGMTSNADMALLKIDAAKPLPSVPFGDSDKMQVGDRVIAIGSPFGFADSVTSGIVSAVNRDVMESPFDDYIQTDAAINHGNSGGPLFNLAGEVIGMNSILYAPGSYSGSIGLGFAIPSNSLRFVVDRLISTGKVNAGMLPIRTQPLSWMLAQAMGAPSLNGALVSALPGNGDQMMKGQIKPGDIILSFNGDTVTDPRDLARKAAQAPVGSEAMLGVLRAGGHEVVRVSIQAWPEATPPKLSESPTMLGLTLSSGPQGSVVVSAVDPSGSAADSGIQKGDIILQVREQTVSDPVKTLQMLNSHEQGQSDYKAVLVERDDKHAWIALAVPE